VPFEHLNPMFFDQQHSQVRGRKCSVRYSIGDNWWVFSSGFLKLYSWAPSDGFENAGEVEELTKKDTSRRCVCCFMSIRPFSICFRFLIGSNFISPVAFFLPSVCCVSLLKASPLLSMWVPLSLSLSRCCCH
jgi:hypothetical protein